jgi:phenylpropionate dioxygenase-like ring-hydroxylating dioxygenase large terminal subunit
MIKVAQRRLTAAIAPEDSMKLTKAQHEELKGLLWEYMDTGAPAANFEVVITLAGNRKVPVSFQIDRDW